MTAQPVSGEIVKWAVISCEHLYSAHLGELKSMKADMTDTHQVVIVGSGFAGIAQAVALKRAGVSDFVLLEKADEVGGTWRENTYPGAECDVPSALYSYSFAHNSAWRYKWSEQSQILDYMRHVADEQGVRAHVRFGAELASAVWDASSEQWALRLVDGRLMRARYLVSAVGQLHHPAIPVIEGAETFAGPAFHSARWRHDVDLTGKRVAVIGNAASAVQFIPQVAKSAAQLTVFQRSANWILPKQDRVYLPIEQTLSEKFPWLARLYRFRLWLFGELFLYGIMKGNRLLRNWAQGETRRYLERTIPDAALREKLIPDYPMGAKRVLFSDDYYSALAQPNVELVTDGVERLCAHGVVCRSGRVIEADVLVYGTGFRTNPFLSPMQITGVNGVTLREAWRGGAQAYLGVTTAGFPNLFMLYGPNTNLGSNSMLVMIEAQSRYIAQCVASGRVLAVRAQVERDYNVRLQERLSHMAWNAVAQSWYKDGGRITNNWPGSTFEYLLRMRRVDWSAYA
jgi:cation diffusion facilitator CzcD-associated flavoprotein CzcO